MEGREKRPLGDTCCFKKKLFFLCVSVCFVPEVACGLPDHVAQQVPSERQLSLLASVLGDEWESVAMDLGVSSAALFRCRADNALCCRDAVLAALLLWRRSQGKNATARRLQESLRAAGIHSAVLRDVMMA